MPSGTTQGAHIISHVRVRTRTLDLHRTPHRHVRHAEPPGNFAHGQELRPVYGLEFLQLHARKCRGPSPPFKFQIRGPPSPPATRQPYFLVWRTKCYSRRLPEGADKGEFRQTAAPLTVQLQFRFFLRLPFRSPPSHPQALVCPGGLTVNICKNGV